MTTNAVAASPIATRTGPAFEMRPYAPAKTSANSPPSATP